jgi:hypothetical protein
MSDLDYGWAARILLLAILGVVTVGAAAQSRFVISADGTEVTDRSTGLIWRRCSEGQSWSGQTCAGSPSTFTHEQVLAHAGMQPGWRLPNVKELASIIDRRKTLPAIDLMTFPDTPAHPYWSSSPYAVRAEAAWFVSFSDGRVLTDYRYNSHRVRLLR